MTSVLVGLGFLAAFAIAGFCFMCGVVLGERFLDKVLSGGDKKELAKELNPWQLVASDGAPSIEKQLDDFNRYDGRPRKV